jgi:acyl carrier protein phosphodiesterase
MHYLTHLYLSRNFATNIAVGNFIGIASKRICFSDTNKRNYYNIEHDYIKGVVLHDMIDNFINQHPTIIECKKKLIINTKFKSESIDLIFDHFLAVNWDKYCDTPLEDFCQNTYEQLTVHQKSYPYKTKRVYTTILRYGLLEQYKTLEGLHKIVKQLGKLTGNTLMFESSLVTLMNNYSQFQKYFDEFFPQLIEYTAAKQEVIKNLNISGDIERFVFEHSQHQEIEEEQVVIVTK